MTITKLTLGEDGARNFSNQLKDTISELGGKVLSSDFWGKRKFAYKIGHETEGHYDIVSFELGEEGVSGLKQKLNTNENLVRYLITLASKDSRIGGK